MGSATITDMYVGTKQGSKFIRLAFEPILVEVAGRLTVDAPQVEFQSPLLSAILWPTAFKIVLTLLQRWVFLAWANCLAGFKATITTAAKMAMMPMTTNNSINVKPFRIGVKD